MSTGGSVIAAGIGGRNFPVAADSAVKMNQGGYNNDVEPNGDGTARLIKTRMAWAVSDLNVDVNFTAGDFEFLQSLADGSVFVAITLSLVDGSIWNGQGIPADEIVADTQKATCALALKGSGRLTPQ